MKKIIPYFLEFSTIMGNQQGNGYARDDDDQYGDQEYYDMMRRENEEREKYVKMLDTASKEDAKSYLQQYPDHKLDDPKLDLNWAFYDNQITNMGDEIAARVEEMHGWFGDYEKLEST